LGTFSDFRSIDLGGGTPALTRWLSSSPLREEVTEERCSHWRSTWPACRRRPSTQQAWRSS